jgi:hypothetical protein
MKTHKSSQWLLVLLLIALLTVEGATYRPSTTSAAVPPTTPQGPRYVVLGWNNLGMHCYNPDFSNLAILPPYNTLVAQIVKVGDPPQIVTSGVTVEYRFPDNTWSVNRRGRPDKTNFWEYSQALFGVALPPNIGLTGKGLSGTMDKAADGVSFVADGIPLTDIRDQDAVSDAVPMDKAADGVSSVAEGIPIIDIRDRDSVSEKTYPFQKAVITVRDADSLNGVASSRRTVLAQLTVVAPVSTELRCGNCHSDDMDATSKYAPDVQPTGKIETNILAIHDYLNKDNYATYLADYPDLLAKTPLMDHQPVLCATCHGSNALGMPIVGEIKNLSNAMHGHHNPDNAPDITPDTGGCYNCHPGPTTRCLRDTMSQNFSANCTNCHGDITEVAKNPNPWLNEPKCSQCHGSGYDTSLPLYRESQGHGGIYCEGCHDSTHAIAPSRESNDTIKFFQLQRHSGSLSKCTVCHATQPTGMFHHAK